MKCKYCKKQLKSRQKKYCSPNCQYKDRYKHNRDYYLEQARKWDQNNKEKSREIHLKSNRKFREEKKKRFNQLMLNNYYKNKDKWISRNWTYQILNRLKKRPQIDNFCKKCKSKNDLRLKFEIYPTKAKKIRKAIQDKQIYYLCKDCR